MNTFLIFANILQLLSDTVFFTLYSFFYSKQYQFSTYSNDVSFVYKILNTKVNLRKNIN